MVYTNANIIHILIPSMRNSNRINVFIRCRMKTFDLAESKQIIHPTLQLSDLTHDSNYMFTPFRSPLGFVQFIDSQTITEVLANDGSIHNYFRKHAPSENGPYGIAAEVMDSYIKSCGQSNSLLFSPEYDSTYLVL